MKKIWNWIKNNPNRAMFLVPILLVAIISISHVVSFYDMANPHNWAIYLSIAIEIGAITALVAATNRIKGGIWFMFGLVTFVQLLGNIFYSYKEIDPNGELFKAWVELTGPVWELMGTEQTDTVGLKRWLAFLEGGLLPLISLTSLHFFVKYEKKEDDKEEVKSDDEPQGPIKHIIERAEAEQKKDEPVSDESVEDTIEEPVEEELAKEEDNFEDFVEKKKKKLEEDRKIFIPLLEFLYKNGEIGKGEEMPAYPEFKSMLDGKGYTDDNIKMFLTLCNYLKITELADNVRKSKVDFEDAKRIMNNYLSLDEAVVKPEENVIQVKTQNPENITKENIIKDWWNKR
jgi:hypothetical protein